VKNQKTHRRNIAVALFVGMFLAAPVFSLTANAQSAGGQRVGVSDRFTRAVEQIPNRSYSVEERERGR